MSTIAHDSNAHSGKTPSQEYPLLSDEEWGYLDEVGIARQFEPGEVLVHTGTKDYSFFAIRAGDTAVLENSSGETKLVGHHPPGSFTGDIDMMTGRPAVVTIVAETQCDVIEVTACLSRLILQTPNIDVLYHTEIESLCGDHVCASVFEPNDVTVSA